MTLYEKLTDEQTGVGIPVVYSHYDGKQDIKPPYIAYNGNGQDNFKADYTYYHNENRYQIEYYYTLKDESIEANIEKCLLDNGLRYDKSEDVYIEDQNIFVIYYQV